LSRWKDGKLTDLGDVKGMVQSFAEDESGKLWLLVHNKDGKPICEVAGSGVTCYGKESGLMPSGRCCDSMITDGKGTFWMGTDTSLVEWREHTASKSFPIAAKIKAGTPGELALARNPTGEIWAGLPISGPGLGLQRLVSGQWQPFHTATLDGASLAVLTVFQDRAGSLWIGTMDHGIYRLTSGRVDHFDNKDGLTSDSVYSFFEDKEGSIWAATSAGIDRFRDFKVWSYATREGLTVDEVDAVLASHDGTIWAGTANSLAVLVRTGIHSLRAGKELPGTQVTSLFEDQEGRLWVGIDKGLWIYAAGKFTAVIKQNEKGGTGLIRALAQDAAGDVWASYEHPSKLIRFRDDRVVEDIDVSADHSVRSMAPDPDGGLWLGLQNGDLAHTGVPEREVSTHLNTYMRDVAVASHGLVLGATSKGLVVFKQGALRILSSKDGLPCDAVNGLVDGDDGSLWLFMSCGLARVDLSTIGDALRHPDHAIGMNVIGAIDGLRPGSAPFQRKVARAPDGTLWFANGVVLQSFDPHAHIASSDMPSIHIESLTADRKQYPFGGDLTLPALTRDVQIDYTATELAVPQHVRFRYRLDGRDQDWVDAGQRRQAFYTDLPPGTYRFHVAANNDSNGWKEVPATLDFFVKPAFYQTGLFMVLVVATLALVLWLLFAWRIAQAKIQMRAIVEERHAERERIARELHDTFLQAVHGLVLRFHVAVQRIPSTHPARTSMERALDYADEVIVEGRDRVTQLRALEYQKALLEDSLRLMAQKLDPDNRVTFKLKVEGTHLELDSVAGDEVLHLAQEAMTNAFCHARASHIDIGVAYERKRLRLSVVDDGIGFDVDTIAKKRATGHWGLEGMRERAANLRAKLAISSRPGAGTALELVVPGAIAYRHSTMSWRRWLYRLPILVISNAITRSGK
jgi:signal transduction histidine kinase/ligand-binding sensor domain-containing protein